MTLLRSAGQTTFVTSVTDRERIENSTAAVREQGAVAPAIRDPPDRPRRGHLPRRTVAALTGLRGLREPGRLRHPLPAFAGFENPGAYVTEAPAFQPGLENPGAYPAEIAPPAEAPVIVNGQPCGQCR